MTWFIVVWTLEHFATISQMSYLILTLRTHLASITTWDNLDMMAETPSYIFRWCSRCHDVHNKPWSRVCDRWQFYSLSKHFTLLFQIDRRSKNYYMGIGSYWLWRLKIPSGTRSPSENCLTFSWSNSKSTRWYGYEKYGLLTACKFWVGNIFITACLSDHEFKWYMLNVLQ